MCGTVGTYEDVVSMQLGGRVRAIDRCIHGLVAALDCGPVSTVASCCGHGKRVGLITLEDKRSLLVLPADLFTTENWTESEQAQIEDAVTEMMVKMRETTASEAAGPSQDTIEKCARLGWVLAFEELQTALGPIRTLVARDSTSCAFLLSDKLTVRSLVATSRSEVPILVIEALLKR